jgi:hypothetical protein
MSAVMVFGSVAGALVLWAVAEWWRHQAGRSSAARAAWTAGAALMTVHSIAAFMVIYGGSHAVAVAATARQTAALTGVESGAGIYVNYVFLVLWIADASWWWISPGSYATRPRVIATGIQAIFLFMFLNGGVLFADGWMRVLGAAVVTAVLVAWARDARRRRAIGTVRV